MLRLPSLLPSLSISISLPLVLSLALGACSSGGTGSGGQGTPTDGGGGTLGPDGTILPPVVDGGSTPAPDDGSTPDAISITPPVNDADMPASDAGPGGPWVAFVSSRAGDFDIYLAHDDGTDVHPIVSGAGNDLSPAWAPDGARIAFESNRGSDAGTYGIFIVDLVSGAITPLTTGLSDAVSPAWSPDGTQIVVGGPNGLYTVPSTGGTATPITTGMFRDNSPAWAPDGTIYFSSNRAADGSFDVWSVQPDGGGVTQVTTGTGILGGPAISHDGATIALALAGGASTEVEFYSLAAKSTAVFSTQGDYEPSFNTAGTMLAVTSTRYDQDNPEVVLMGIPDASTPFRLTNSPGVDGEGTFQPGQ